ncbi:MFS transporter [Shewanella avicenniae]|uniref:MFS transporter n=1 Tax=Shewanella avicenniae TaxID=2814294 RepID=A0ABX7QNI1_9GAMM|nr:MFS transporter [Shewanella avicenniae]QSX32271.1 MFS transporter [Shewanella avicenniae]
MASNHNSDLLNQLYNRITGEQDARVCKDIPAAACDDQPRNFFAYLAANSLGKIADEIGSAKLLLPWLFGSLGVPALLIGFLVPIREAGVLIPQLMVAALVRRMPIRKYVWLVGAMLSALSLFGMAWAALNYEGATAGIMMLSLLVIFSIARGFCSVSAKDVLGKTISKSRRGRLMGLSSAISGIAVLMIGLSLGSLNLANAELSIFAWLLTGGGSLWLVACLLFYQIREQPGVTEAGGNALSVAIQQIALLKTDQMLRQFVIARAMLLSVALVSPFYVLLAQQHVDSALMGLGALIVANGLGTSISAPFWGYLGDRASKQVMILGAIGAGCLGLFTFIGVRAQWPWLLNEYGFALLFMLLNIMHSGVRLGRKVFLVDMATSDTRAAYVAVSNTSIGILMLFGGLIGLLGDWFGANAIVLLLSMSALLSVCYLKRLPNVSEP